MSKLLRFMPKFHSPKFSEIFHYDNVLWKLTVRFLWIFDLEGNQMFWLDWNENYGFLAFQFNHSFDNQIKFYSVWESPSTEFHNLHSTSSSKTAKVTCITWLIITWVWFPLILNFVHYRLKQIYSSSLLLKDTRYVIECKYGPNKRK